MISISMNGGLSNQLFQSAFIFSYAKKYGLDYCVEKEVVNPHIAGKPAYQFPGIKYCASQENLSHFTEPQYNFSEIPKMDGIRFVNSYFQSWKYFNEYRDEVLKAFNFKWHPTDKVSIHKRLGDYKKLPDYHPVISDEYIHKAVQHFVSLGHKRFVVFSDGINEMKNLFNYPFYKNCEFEYSEGRTEIEDLEYMSSCFHNIICNSTFSWWAQYLNQNPNKIVIAPQKDKWFGKKLDHNVDDLYMPNWILL